MLAERAKIPWSIFRPGFPAFTTGTRKKIFNNDHMFSFVRLSFIAFLLVSSCGIKGESELSKALSGAVKENKVSQRKMNSIIKEYEMLRDRDRETSRKYVDGILNALKMGGDSSHIDVVRRLLVEEDGKAKV